MKTIASNRIQKFLPRFANIRCYSLDNSFTGEPVTSLDFAVRVGAKFQWDGATKGRARCHSNLWYDFDVLPA